MTRLMDRPRPGGRRSRDSASALLPGRQVSHDEDGSIILAVILMVLLAILTLTSITFATGQVNLSSETTARNSDLQGALAGVQAAVADIRAASTSGYVVPYELPCTTNTPLTGYTNTSSSSSYTASIQYYDEPTGGGTPVAVSSCTPGGAPGDGPATISGDYLAEAVVTSCSPSTACPEGATSAPEDTATWRRVVSTYDFNTSVANIPGGFIYSYHSVVGDPGDSADQCLEATYNNGTNVSGGVTLEVTTSCSTSNTLEQFQYTSAWNLVIVLDGEDYCVQDPEDSSPASASPVPITTNCGDTAVAQWGVNDNGGIQGVANSGTPSGQPYTTAGGAEGACLANPLAQNASNETEDATVESTDCDSTMDQESTWQLSPEVGAGASQPLSGQAFGVTDQLVNFDEFGRCLDVTGESVSATYLIDYMCKQFPDTTDYPAWNQRWCFDQVSTNNGNPEGTLWVPYTTGQDTTTCSAGESQTVYCLTSPLEVGGPYNDTTNTGNTEYVTVTSCNPASIQQNGFQTSQKDLEWTEWGVNGGSTYDYTWTDANTDCLEANPANQREPSADYFSTIQVVACNGSSQQKWNAPPTFGESEITNTHEGTGSGAYAGP